MTIDIPQLDILIDHVSTLSNKIENLESLLFANKDKPYLTVTEVCKELKFSDVTIKNWINKGRRHPVSRKIFKLPCVKSEGGHYRIKRKDLEEFKNIFSTK